MSPEPVYRSVFGYGHSGRLRVVFDRPVYGPIVAGKRLPLAMISSGATPFSIQFTIGVSMSKLSVAMLPLQWPMFGTRWSFMNFEAPATPPFFVMTSCKCFCVYDHGGPEPEGQ